MKLARDIVIIVFVASISSFFQNCSGSSGSDVASAVSQDANMPNQ